MTVVGRSGALLALLPIKDESADEVRQSLADTFSSDLLEQTQSVRCDNPSGKLHNELSKIMPNLHVFASDTIHPSIVYETAHGKKRTAGSVMLRVIFHKFSKTSSTRAFRWERGS